MDRSILDLKVLRIREVKLIHRNNEDLGYDFFMPKFNKEFMNVLNEKNINSVGEREISLKNKTITLEPYSEILIPSGIKIIFPENYGMRVTNKSGVSTKQKLIVGAELIDPGYHGEIHIHLFNVSNRHIEIHESQKIAQATVEFNFNTHVKEISPEKFSNLIKNSNSIRKDKGFGSTQKNGVH